jgi:hypothetical protein
VQVGLGLGEDFSDGRNLLADVLGVAVIRTVEVVAVDGVLAGVVVVV